MQANSVGYTVNRIIQQGSEAVFEKPPMMSQALSELLEKCWELESSERPNMRIVQAELY